MSQAPRGSQRLLIQLSDAKVFTRLPEDESEGRTAPFEFLDRRPCTLAILGRGRFELRNPCLRLARSTHSSDPGHRHLTAPYRPTGTINGLKALSHGRTLGTTSRYVPEEAA